jgi:hypothetical protein
VLVCYFFDKALRGPIRFVAHNVIAYNLTIDPLSFT